MLKNTDTRLRADLRKKNSFRDELEYANIDIQSCMVMLGVFLVLLLSVFSVVAAQNPYLI